MDQFLPLLLQYKYLALFPLACIEGPLVSLISGFLIYTGFLQIIPVCIVLILGDIVPDSIYYYIGRIGHHNSFVEKYSSRAKIVSGSFDVIKKLWENHPRKTMFLGKLAYGLAIPFLISAGLIKMPFKKFISLTVPVSLFQYGILVVVGFFLGKSYEVAVKYAELGAIFMALVLIVFVAGYVYMLKYSKEQIKKLEEEEKKENKLI